MRCYLALNDLLLLVLHTFLENVRTVLLRYSVLTIEIKYVLNYRYKI